MSLMQTERRPVHEAQQAALLLDWGFAVPAGTAGVGRLVDPGEVATTTAAPSPATTSRAAAAQAPATTAPAHLAPGWLAAGAGVLAVAVLGAVLTVRRRARSGGAPPPG